jgi:hypothetical protein
VCEEFGCSIYDIVCYANTFFESGCFSFLLLSMVLIKEYQNTKLLICTPTVVREENIKLKNIAGLQQSIQRIKSNCNYEKSWTEFEY